MDSLLLQQRLRETNAQLARVVAEQADELVQQDRLIRSVQAANEELRSAVRTLLHQQTLDYP